MCGVFTAFNYGEQKLELSKLKEAVNLVEHRGPDHIGFDDNDVCFMGHSRLSILGLEESGNQPFYFNKHRMVYNGEIFNYVELREELKECGYVFESESDTEVVLKAYDCWGEECFSKFNGMWSLVIQNCGTGELIVSRDRFGQKPLFYLNRKGVYYFASEVQQLAPFTEGEIDYFMIKSFLREGSAEQDGRSFFDGIHSFPKSNYWKINNVGETIKKRYWDYPVESEVGNSSNFTEFEELLEDAVKIRLRSDVPFGVLLSGGVDSTLVSYYACKNTSEEKPRIPAFTYSSEDADDESIYAGRVAEKLGLGIDYCKQDLNPDDYLSRLRAIVQHLGRGHSSPAIVSIDYLYEKIAESGIKVALDGQGADELLAGYKTYHLTLISSSILSGRFKQAFYLIEDLYREGPLNSFLMFLRNTLPESGKKLMRRIYGYEKFFSDVGDFNGIKKPAKVKLESKQNALNKYLIEQHDVGLSNLLYYGDIVAMKNSVENRSPFMDHRLVDFSFKAGEKLKVWNGIDKYVLRTLPAYDLFREELERKKIGFSSDIKLQTKEKMTQELINSSIWSWPIFSLEVKKHVESGMLMQDKYERFMFRLYQVHIWNDIFRAKSDI
ncbi:MAG: asparagine synthase (glutamine-hydrolyzing) [Bermanella sp.]